MRTAAVMIRLRHRESRPKPWPWLVLATAFTVLATLALPVSRHFVFGEPGAVGRQAALRLAARGAETAREAIVATIENARTTSRAVLAAAGDSPVLLSGGSTAEVEVTLREHASGEPDGFAVRLGGSSGGTPVLVFERWRSGAASGAPAARVATIRMPIPVLAGARPATGLVDTATRRGVMLGGPPAPPRIDQAILAAIAAGPPSRSHVALPSADGEETSLAAWTAVPGTGFVTFAAVPVVPGAGQSAVLWFLASLLAGAAALVFLLLYGNRERRRLSDDLARARQDHEAAIRALSERQNLETLGRLTAGVAHDMGNVMQTVEFYLRSIPDSLDDREATLRLIERARSAARRGAVGARDLLALARGSARPPEAIDLRPLLTELGEVMQELLGERFTVRLNLPLALPRVLAEPGDLEAMLINLATNARDAMAEAGHGVLGISVALIGSPDAPVGPNDVTGGEWVRIDITDTGIGMPPEVLERAMEPFFTTKPRGRGTGLGLALAREFAERSGGMLHIESTPGSGTRTSIFLHPASEAGPGTATDASLSAGDGGAGLAGPEAAGDIHAPG